MSPQDMLCRTFPRGHYESSLVALWQRRPPLWALRARSQPLWRWDAALDFFDALSRLEHYATAYCSGEGELPTCPGRGVCLGCTYLAYNAFLQCQHERVHQSAAKAG